MAKALPDPEELTYEEALEALEAIVQRAETGELPLEEAMAEHARGEALLKRCRVLLDGCLLYTSPSPRDQRGSRMPSSA